MNKPLSITIGIPTCYGGESLVSTVLSIRNSKGGENVRIFVTADRTPLTKKIRNRLRDLGVMVTWNKEEGSQTHKIRRMVVKSITDIYISTQDDITFESDTIIGIRKAFTEDASLTMAGIRIKPLSPQTRFESAMGSMLRIVDSLSHSWKDGDNHLSASGRCLGFRLSHLKKFRIPKTLINSDMFFYLENARLHGKFRQLDTTYVSIRCPRFLKDQIAPSSRYLYSEQEMNGYFDRDLSQEYRIPKLLLFRSLIHEFIMHPVDTVFYLGIRAYTYLVRQSRSSVSNPLWSVDTSTKL